MPDKNEQIIIDVQNNLKDSIGELDTLSNKMEETAKAGDGIGKSFIRAETKLNRLTVGLNKAKDSIKDVDFPAMAKNMPVKSFEKLTKDVESFQAGMKQLTMASDPKEIESLTKSLQTLSDRINSTASRFRSYNNALNDVDKTNKNLVDSQSDVVTTLKPDEIANYTNKIRALEIAQEELQKAMANVQTPKGQEKFQNIATKIKSLQAETQAIATKATKEAKKHVSLAEDLEEQRAKIFKHVKAEAKIASQRNKDLRKKLKQEEGGVASLGARMKLWRKNVPNAAMAKFGKLGVVAGKAMKGLGKAMMSIPGLGAILALGGLIAALAAADKRIKGMRKNIISLAAESGEWEKSVGRTGRAYVKTGSSVDIIRQKQEQLAKQLHTTPDEINEWSKSLVGVGFKLSETRKNLKDVSAISTRIGLDFSTMSGLFGQVREELGQGFDETENALVGLIDKAEESGMTMSRFYNKVINAASGLGIYGTKLVDVGNLFANLQKSMNLPEKAAGEMAEKMVKGFNEMSTEQQYFIIQNSKFEKSIGGALTTLATNFKDLNNATKPEDLMEFAKVIGRDKELMVKDEAQRAKNIKSIRELAKEYLGISGALGNFTDVAVRAARANPLQGFMSRIEKVMTGLKIDIDSDAASVLKEFQSQGLLATDELVKIGNFTREEAIAIEEMMKTQAKEGGKFADIFKSKAQQDNKARLKQLKADDERIKKQTKPVTDAIEEGITQVLNDIYTVLSTGFDFIMPVLAKMGIALKSGFGRLLGVMSFNKGLQKRGLEIQIKAAQDAAKLEMKLASKREQQLDREQESLASKLDVLGKGVQDEKTRKRIDQLRERLVENQKELVKTRKEFAKGEAKAEKFGALAVKASERGENRGDNTRTREELQSARKFAEEQIDEKGVGIKKVKGEIDFTGDIKAVAKEIVNLYGPHSPIPAIAADPIKFVQPLKAEVPGSLANLSKSVGETAIGLAPETTPEVEIKSPTGVVPETDEKATVEQALNDHRTVNIYVNHKDKDYITQVVRTELFNDKRAR